MQISWHFARRRAILWGVAAGGAFGDNRETDTDLELP
jgi:hypothetical protein